MNDYRMAESVPVSLILRERAAGWPTIHPEDFCHRCGARNMLWFVDRDVWLAATAALAAETGHEGIFCPQCFADLHGEQTGCTTIWKLVPESQTASAPGFSMAAKNEALTQIAELTAERDAAREQLAQAEAVIEKAKNTLVDPDARDAIAATGRILSGYPVSSAHTEHDGSGS